VDEALSDSEPEPEELDDLVASDTRIDDPENDWADPEPQSGSDFDPEPELDEEETAAQVQPEVDDWDWPKTRKVAPGPQKSPRRPADVASIDLLKEEADREIAQRRGEKAAPMESQGEFGLAAPDQRETPSRALRARMARLRGEVETAPKPEEPEYEAPRRDLLPDIEEINSSLNPAREKRARPRVSQVSHRRGFRLGFVTTVGLSACVVMAYAWAPAIASVFPGSEQQLLSYVDWVNRIRDAF
jgi:hypothetical protein